MMAFCPFDADNTSGVDRPCGFGMLLFKGADNVAFKQRWEDKYPMKEPGCRLRCSAFACGVQADAINRAAYAFPGLHWKMPTNGFQAFLTFAPACKSMRLFGFGGAAAGDGHEMGTAQHDFHAEHVILERLANGTLPADEIQAGRMWPRGNSAWLHEQLVSLRRRGHFAITGPSEPA